MTFKLLKEGINTFEEYELICMLPVGIAEEEITSPAKRPFDERAWLNGFDKKF